MQTKCDCHSYNAGIGTVPPVALPIQKYFPGTEHDSGGLRESVCVDACIAHVIEELWKEGIQTLGCCCGHSGRIKFMGGHPDVILKNPADAQRASEILKKDGRTWKMFMWVY